MHGPSSFSRATIPPRRRQGCQGETKATSSSRHASVVGGLVIVPGSSPVQMPKIPAVVPDELAPAERRKSFELAEVATPQAAYAQQCVGEGDSSPTKIANRLRETMTALHSKVLQTDENARPEQLLVILEHLLHISGTKDHTNAVWSFVTNMVLRASYLDADISASAGTGSDIAEDTGALTRGFDKQLKTGLTSLWRRLSTDSGKGNGTMPTKTIERVLEYHGRQSKVDAATNTEVKITAEVQTQTSQDEKDEAASAALAAEGAGAAVDPLGVSTATTTAEVVAEDSAGEYVAIDGASSSNACLCPGPALAAVATETLEVPRTLQEAAETPVEEVQAAVVPWTAPLPAGGDQIKVFVRVRPEPKLKPKKSVTGSRLTKAAKAKAEAQAGKCAEPVTDTMIMMSEKTTAKSRGFTFDSVLGEASTQDQIFGLVGKDVVENCLNGYNGTIFAYGICYLVALAFFAQFPVAT